MKAKNAFGVQDTMRFRVDSTIDENGASELVYFEMDGKILYGKPNVPEIVKVPLDDIASENGSSIILRDGVVGNYGKEDDFSGTKIIRYYIPAGKYIARCKTRGSGFYIESISKHKEDGYETSDIFEQIMFSNTDEKHEIEIDDKSCISLIVNSIIEFEKIE